MCLILEATEHTSLCTGIDTTCTTFTSAAGAYLNRFPGSPETPRKFQFFSIIWWVHLDARAARGRPHARSTSCRAAPAACAAPAERACGRDQVVVKS